ncbi:heme ABC transporter ATP-binding protein [Gordonia sp. KTR9]|uniref:heme ABC transporter ATP-binding protein n=1 Tax=Gordonia sp. KTR9 TaxID=337191 RepID=UPI00027DE54B|nr:heme ABC transporter ATP-binding protein [Gordonia sp. KTR9]AFR48687.1 ABC-type hemin transport system, ATPase component [Gordonia sp. KTR9]
MVTAETPATTVLGIRAEDVSVVLGEREVVRGVSLDVGPGELVALVGPNGCGKSTLLSALSGTRTPQRGHIEVDGRDVTSTSMRELARHRSLVTQQNRVDTPFTVAQVVAMGRYPWLRTPRAADSPAVIADAMALCELGDIADRPFGQLSGGQQARVSLARALAQDTPVMMLDEPTAALDIHHQEQVLDILRIHRDAGNAVLLVVHDLTLAAAYADRVAVMKDGRLLASGPTSEVMTVDLLSRTYDHPVEVIEHAGRRVVLPVRAEGAPRTPVRDHRRSRG